MSSISKLTDSAKLIYESGNSLIYYQEKGEYETPVIIKVLRQERPGPDQIVRFANEYECLKGLDIPGIRKAYAKTTVDGKPALVLEFVGGQTVRRVIAEEKMGTGEVLRIALSAAQALEHIHAHRLIHKDINGNNIIVDRRGTFSATIIDFGISSRIDTKTEHLGNPDRLEGTLAYISPEQTGRMNRAVDYRTDLYSLGVTFYEMLTGSLPFETDDSMEMIHSHIAKVPVPVCEVNPEIPKAISDIVAKLMAKNAEDRYQSAYGLKTDLAFCFENLKNISNMSGFKPGLHDISGQFHIPQKLYGRSEEIRMLLETFGRVSRGTAELVMVSGYSGVGKSSLVREIHKPITERRGHFVSGKYDQFQRNMPYATIIQTLTEFVNCLLTESPEKLAIWKEKISEATGNNGQVLTDLIPAFELVIGRQPPVPELGPAESRNRINLVFQNVIKAISRKEHPFVIFADDLQWADSASLNLISVLMSDEESRYLLLIGAYRDNEVYPTHPLMMTLNEIREKNITAVNTIRLDNLLIGQVNELIADTLYCERSYAEPLTQLIYEKTRGNAFFVNEFFKSLYEEELLRFDHEKREWVWDVLQIREKNITDNVVELMAGKLRKLPPETQSVLKFAACIGNLFEIETLSVIYESPEEQTLAHLWRAIEEGLILPLDENYKLLSQLGSSLSLESTNLKSSFRFLHDRVQQAAYQQIPEAERKAVHRSVGRLLLDHTPEEKLEDRIFDIVNHLNQGADIIEDSEERNELARLNLIAGKKGMASAAFESAFDYLNIGIGVLEKECWKNQYDLTLALHSEGTEAASLSGKFETMENLFQIVTQNSRKVLDKVGVYQSKIQSYVSQGKLQDALNTALDILEQLGEKLPAYPTQDDIQRGLEETKTNYAGKEIANLADLPKMTDPHKIAVMRILAQSTAAAYIGRPELFQPIIFKKVNLSIRYGNSPDSPYGYACYALILCGVDVGDFDNGYHFGKLAADVMEKIQANKFKSKVLEVVNGHVWHFKQHLKETLEPLEIGYQSGKETGDLEYAGYNAFFYSCNAFFAGRELNKLEKEMSAYNEGIRQIRAETARRWQGSFWQAAQNLLGKSENPCQLIGEAYDQEKMLPILRETNNQAAMGALYVNRLMLCYLFGEYQEAIENSEFAFQNRGGLVAMYAVPVWFFYDSLARLAIYPSASESEQKSLMEKVNANQQEMKNWADHAPMNHLHKWHLVEAERLQAIGSPMKDIIEHYDNAIELAKEHEYIQEEALANELTAKFWMAKEKKEFAGIYMKKACYCYHLWGAKAKVSHMEKEYGNLLAAESFTPERSTTISKSTADKGTLFYSTSRASSLFDTATIMKASQAISQEVYLDRLLDKMIRIAMENAGATKGFLVIKEKDMLLIQAKGETEQEKIETMQGIPLEQSEELPLSVIHYVARTQKSLVLNDLLRDRTYSKDPYINSSQLKSLLCLPIIHQGRLTGILYLENNLTTDAFTSERLELLKILSAQAAISIENAMLYANLEEKVTERTAELAAANAKLSEAMDALWGEMELAKKIQTVLLPKKPEIRGYEISASMEPCEQVGGDYYDVISVGGFDWIVIGDVSGHGVTAGLVMMMVQTAIHAVLNENPETEPSKLLSVINKTIYDNIERMGEAKHMTIIVLAAGKDGKFSFSGLHEDILIRRAKTGKVEKVESGGMWIGLEPDISGYLSDDILKMEPGDCMVLFTDGITEAFCEEGKLFGNERLIGIIEKNGDKSAAEIRENIIRALDTCETPDDVTMVVMKRK